MQTTTPRTRSPRKPRPKPERGVFLVEAPYLDGHPGTLRLTVGKEATFYEVTPIPEAAWGTAFVLTKEDRTSYAVNLGDEAQGMAPTCECPGFLRWGHLGPCKHLDGLRALVSAGKL
jgi:hypothetical protein